MQKTSDFVNLIIIISRDIRDSYLGFCPAFINIHKIVKNKSVRLSSTPPVYVNVYRLYVIEKCVGIRHYAVYSLARDKTAGVNRGIYFAAVYFLQNLAASLALQQALAAGKSDSAAALVIKAPILNERGAYLVNGHLRAEYFNRALWRGLRRCPALRTKAIFADTSKRQRE